MNCNKNVLLIFTTYTSSHLILTQDKVLGKTTKYEGRREITPPPPQPSEKPKNEQCLLEKQKNKMITVQDYICA